MTSAIKRAFVTFSVLSGVSLFMLGYLRFGEYINQNFGTTAAIAAELALAFLVISVACEAFRCIEKKK